MLKIGVGINHSTSAPVDTSNLFDSILYPNIGLKNAGAAKGTVSVEQGENIEFLFLPLLMVDKYHIEKTGIYDSTDPSQRKILDINFNDLNIDEITESSFSLEPGLYWYVIKIPPSEVAQGSAGVYVIANSTPPAYLGVELAPPWGPNYLGLLSPSMAYLDQLFTGSDFYCSLSSTSLIKGSRKVLCESNVLATGSTNREPLDAKCILTI